MRQVPIFQKRYPPFCNGIPSPVEKVFISMYDYIVYINLLMDCIYLARIVGEIIIMINLPQSKLHIFAFHVLPMIAL